MKTLLKLLPKLTILLNYAIILMNYPLLKYEKISVKVSGHINQNQRTDYYEVSQIGMMVLNLLEMNEKLLESVYTLTKNKKKL